MRIAWLLSLLLVLAEPIEAGVFRLQLGAGANLVSLPRSAEATSEYQASHLLRDTGALAVVELTGSLVYLGESLTPDFPLPAGRPVLVLVDTARTVTLFVPTDASTSLPSATVSTRRGLDPLSLPVLAGATSSLNAADLTRLTSAGLATRGTIVGGFARFESHVAGAAGAGFPLEPGRGYILAAASSPISTQFTLYVDGNGNGIPDDLDASIPGGAAGDVDGDGLSNLAELRGGTAPGRADTDLDGAADGLEVTRGSDPFDPASRPPPRFAADVYPIFLNRCSGCHSPGGRGTGDWAADTAQASYSELQRFEVLNTSSPEESLILRKPLAPSQGGIGMDGGFTVIFQTKNDPDYQTILRWIRAGAISD